MKVGEHFFMSIGAIRLSNETMGFYLRVAQAASYMAYGASIPERVVRNMEVNGKLRKRLIRELEEGRVATLHEDGSLELAVHSRDERWIHLGCPDDAHSLFSINQPDFARAMPRQPVSRQQRAHLLDNADGLCGICKEELVIENGYHIDHIVPVARGGRTELDNLQLAHPACNVRKGARVG